MCEGGWVYSSVTISKRAGDSTMRNIANGALAALGFSPRFYKEDSCFVDPKWSKVSAVRFCANWQR